MPSSLIAVSSLALADVAEISGRRDAVRVVYTFTDGAYPGNLAVRANGDLLINSLSNGRIYTLNPTAREPQASVLVQLPPDVASGFTGIAEYAHDKFAMVSGKFDLEKFSTEDATIWSLDVASASTTTVKLKKIAVIPSAGLPNSITTLDSTRKILLAADSSYGAVWSIDLRRGSATKIAEDEALKATVSTRLPLGVNGIRATRNGPRSACNDIELYFTNWNTETLRRVPVNRDGSFAGETSLVARIQGGVNDFAIGEDGRMWTAGISTFLNVVYPDGKVDAHDVFWNAANPGQGNPTAVAFGRGSKAQEKVLYVLTSWGVVYAVDTTRI